jgi:carbonic anhydrase/acetyltransferase-like protein (isoleucine patch superfamily)
MKKNYLRRIFNRVLHMIARICPGSMTLRPFLHRLRGVKVGQKVWIGDDVYLENEYPELVELHDGAVLSIRSMIIAHTRGAGSVVVGRDAFIGPNAVVACVSGKTIKIGDGAVVSMGSVVTSSVAPQMVVAPPKSIPVARARVPFGVGQSMEQFISGLEPLKRSQPKNNQSVGKSSDAVS